MITDRITTNISVDELRKELCKTYNNVKIISKGSLLLDYFGTKVIISKQKKGYDVSPNIPGYVFWLFFLLVVIIFFCINNVNLDNINSDNWPDLIFPPAISGLVFGGILYWIFADIYVVLKKGKIVKFINSLNIV